jgi:hypothetical protein
VRGISGKSGDSATILFEQGGKEKSLVGSHLLVAAGRRPNTENIGLELAGVELTDRGYIRVNERLETTAPGVWAIGEVAGSPQFTHVSVDDFRVVHDNLTGGSHVTTGRQIPFCLFTDPEFARIGLNEKEAKAQGIAYRLFKIPMEAVLRARTVSETRGFVKALVELNSDRLLGFAAIAIDGGEIMASVQTAMMAGLSYTALRDSIWSHPTLVEGLIPLFSSAPSLSTSIAPHPRIMSGRKNFQWGAKNMSVLIKTLTRMGLLKNDLDYHFIRASMVIIYFFFGYQKATVTIIPFMPDGWAASAGGFPAMVGNVAFLMKDVVLLAVSFYLLKQDALRLSSAGSIDDFENVCHSPHPAISTQ